MRDPDPGDDPPTNGKTDITGIHPGTPRTVAPDGIPLAPQPEAETTRPTDLPPPGDAALAPAVSPTSSCPTDRSVVSGDGLRLAVATNGSVAGVQAGGRCLSRLSYGGGFSVRPVGGQTNLLTNGGFETGSGTPSSWYRSGTGPTISTTAMKFGARSAVITRSSTGTSGDLHQTVALSPNTSYTVGGYTKSYDMTPTSFSATNPIVSRDVSPIEIAAAVKDSSGRLLGTYRAYGYTNTSDWAFQSVGFFAGPSAHSATVSIRINAGRGSAWFDGLTLARVLSASSYAVTTSSVVQKDAATISQIGSVSSLGLDVRATYRAKGNHLRIDGTVELKDGITGDRPFQLVYNLPLDATNWYYADYARGSRRIAAATRYTFDSGQTLPTSRYPWSTLYDGSTAISVGSPLSKPRGYTLRYDTRQGWTITLDLGVSSDATKLDKSATFSILLFTSDPSWGFRGATAKYYAVEPSSFQVFPNPKMNGIPFINPDLDALDPPSTPADESKDFGLGMDIVGISSASSWGIRNAKWGDARSIPSAVYVHMWGDFRQKCAEPNQTTCAARTYDQVVADLQRDASQTSDRRLRDESYASLHDAVRDFNGRIRYDAPVGSYRIFTNSDPDFASSATRPSWVATVQKWQIDTAQAAATTAGTQLDGVYVDSTSGFRQWGAVDDYDRTHWAVADPEPLMFSYDTGKVIQRNYFNNYEQVKRLRASLHAGGQFVALDYNGDEVTAGGYLGTDLTDYFLIENGLPDRDYPQWGVTIDSYALLKRSMANQRPLGSVDQHGCAPGFPVSEMRYRVQQSLFYGIFPGPCRWEKTSWWFPEMRALYKQYTPFFQLLAASGWEVVTNARSSNGNVWMERYGNLRDDDLLYTLRNETSSTQQATLTLNLKNSYDNGVAPRDIAVNLRYQVRLADGTYGTKSVTWKTCNGGVTLNAAHTQATVALSSSTLSGLPALTTGVLKVTRLTSCA